MRVLIIPDKFKGTLTATAAAEAIAEGWRLARPADELELLPMSDGGDGFGEIMGASLGATEQCAEVVNAAHEPIRAAWWWSDATQTAIVESARVIGLALLPPGQFHPFELDTYGLGQLLRQIEAARPGSRVIIGIGGTATNDAGFGLARGLGYRFQDVNGFCLERWIEADRLERIISPERTASFRRVTIACDVQNPLLGSQGASRVYGPQKGIRPEDLPLADRCFERLVEIVRRQTGVDFSTEPGTGAAGGLGFGLRAFLQGQFQPGFDLFAEAASLRERIQKADLVITAEGSIDAQTFMGKGTGAIAALARAAGKRCIGLAGVTVTPERDSPFEKVLAIVPALAPMEEAKRNARHWLTRLSQSCAAKLAPETGKS